MLIARPAKYVAGLGGKYLHVARKDQKLTVGPLEDFDDALFLLALAPVDDGKVMKRHAVPFGEAAHVLVIRYHRDDLDRECPRAPAVQNAVEAMSLLRNREHRAAPAPRFVKAPGHGELLPDCCGKFPVEIRERRDALPVVVKDRAHEARVRLGIVEMLRFGDQAVARGEEARDGRYDARRVGTRRDEDKARGR